VIFDPPSRRRCMAVFITLAGPTEEAGPLRCTMRGTVKTEMDRVQLKLQVLEALQSTGVVTLPDKTVYVTPPSPAVISARSATSGTSIGTNIAAG